jgi:Transposase
LKISSTSAIAAIPPPCHPRSQGSLRGFNPAIISLNAVGPIEHRKTPLGRLPEMADVCRKHGISETTFYKWKRKYGGMDVSEASRLKALEAENA